MTECFLDNNRQQATYSGVAQAPEPYQGPSSPQDRLELPLILFVHSIKFNSYYFMLQLASRSAEAPFVSFVPLVKFNIIAIVY